MPASRIRDHRVVPPATPKLPFSVLFTTPAISLVGGGMAHTDHGSSLAVIGMITSVARRPWRTRVRQTMMQDAPPDVTLRFVVGRSSSASSSSLLQSENSKFDDIAQLNTPDTSGTLECACAEKMVLWFRHALHAYAGARFIGKTEDDTYVQLHVLAHELQLLRDDANVVFGFMALVVHPRRPVPQGLTERKPSGLSGCGPLEQSCGTFEGSQFIEGCFLGDLEGKLAEPGRWLRSRYARVVRRCGLVNSSFSPFPTGPLAVLGADTARALFAECAYATAYVEVPIYSLPAGRCKLYD